MAKATVIRYEARADAADENQRLIEQVFAELSSQQPEGLRYAALRLDDGVTFMHIVLTEKDADPLSQLPAFQEFQAGLGGRVAGPPGREGAEIVGSYRFLAE